MWGYAARAVGLTFGIYGTLNALTGQYFSVISPLLISYFWVFYLKINVVDAGKIGRSSQGGTCGVQTPVSACIKHKTARAPQLGARAVFCHLFMVFVRLI